MVSMEYKTLITDKSFWSGKDKIDIEKTLNDLGRDGWDLVSVVPLTNAGSTNTLQLFLKRKRF